MVLFSSKPLVTTVFVDTRLWKTKHPRKHQSCVLSTDWIKIHQSQPASMTCRRSEGHTKHVNETSLVDYIAPMELPVTPVHCSLSL